MAVSTQAKHSLTLWITPNYVPKKNECVCQQTSKIMFIAALFIMAPNWKQPKYFFNRRPYKQIVVYLYSEYSTTIIKKKELLNISLDESHRHYVEQKKHWSFSTDKRNQDDREQISGNHSCGEGWWTTSRKGYKETFWRAEFYILIWVLVTWVCTYVKSHWVVHLRSVHVIFCTFLDYF